jgi:2-methylcitrate dehydratase PrpD
MTLAHRLAEFAVALRFEDIPADVVASVRLRALDIIGLALAASTHDFAASFRGALEGWRADGQCTVIGSAQTAPPPLAILVNGALAHGLDFDDTHPPSVTHASAVVLPTVLALGEAGVLDGRTVVTAAVTGYEAIARLGMAAPGAFHDRGWHATAVCGAFAAALAAAKCDRLDTTRMTAALGLAGSFTSGVMEFLADGSSAKRVHPGWAGHSGAVAAALARGGLTGPATILEGRFGFYRAFLGVAPDPKPFATLGTAWETLRGAFKPYPCCHLNHAYLDCALELRRAHGLDAEQVESIECRVPPGQVPIVCEPREAKVRPRTAYDAQFSLPFSIAASLVDGRVGLDTYAPARLRDERVLDLAARVTHALDPDSRYPECFPGWVRLRLRDGRELEARVLDGWGSLARPMPPEAIVAKFRDNARHAVPPARVAAIERAALGLDALPDIRALTTLCRG